MLSTHAIPQRFLWISLILALGFCPPGFHAGRALAVDRDWGGSTGGDWYTASNWNPSTGSVANGDNLTVGAGTAGTTSDNIVTTATITLNSGAAIVAKSLDASGGTLSLAQGTLTIDSGTFKPVSGSYSLEPAGIDTVTINLLNGADMSVAGYLRLQVGSTLNVTDSSVSATSYIGVGSRISPNTGEGRLVVDGASATVATSSGRMFVGGDGQTGRVTVRNGGSIDIATSLDLADSVAGGTKGYVTVESGGSISVGTDIEIGVRNATSQDAELKITGTNSKLTQSGSGSVTVGGPTNSTGRLIVKDGGSMSVAVGGSGVEINRGGTLEIGDTARTGAGGSLTTPSLDNGNGGALKLYNGVLTIDGGTFTPVQSGQFLVESTGDETTMVVKLNNGASTAIGGNLRFHVGSTLELNNSTATATGNIIIGSYSVSAGTAGKVLVDGASASLMGEGIIGVGGGGRTGYLTVSDQGQVILNGSGKFGIADSSVDDSKGYMIVESGGSIAVGGDVNIGSVDKPGQVAELTITGANSSFAHTGSGATTIGGTSNSVGKVIIDDGGSMSVAGSGITINKLGTLTIGKSDFTGPGTLTTPSLDASATGAVFNFHAGTLTIDGGPLKLPSGNYALEPGGIDAAVINLQNGADMDVAGYLRLHVGSTLNVADSTVSVADFIGIGSRDVNLGRTGEGRMVVDGATAKVTITNRMWVGGGWQTGRVTVSGGGAIVIAGTTPGTGSLALVESNDSNTQGYVDVKSGGSITVNSGNIVIGTRGKSGQVAQMTLDGAGSAVTQNGTGSLQIGATSGSTGGLLSIADGTFTTGSGGTVVNATGTLDLQGGTFNTPSLDDSHGGDFSFTGGRLEVRDFTGSLLNEGGVYAPGLSPAASSITGDYEQGEFATIEMELGGTVLGSEYDHLAIGGATTLDGILSVVLFDGFEPAAGNTFDLFDYDGGVSGNFATYNLPNIGLLEWDYSLVPTTGILRVVPEPTTALMAIFGALFLLAIRRRRAV